MKKICILSVLVLAACGNNERVWKDYQCGKGKTAAVVKARFFKDGAEIETDGRKYTLTQVRSADGAKYAAKGIEFWTKGMDRAMLTSKGKTADCTAK
jgi:membrane-bound inhibitor of C-type lysozyme